MIKRFKVTLMSIGNGLMEHIVNCNDMISARHISEAIFAGMRAIDIVEISSVRIDNHFKK